MRFLLLPAVALLPRMAAAASALLATNTTILNRDVVVIGGGASGTYAAVRLQQEGKTVALVERESRLGGEHLRLPNMHRRLKGFYALKGCPVRHRVAQVGCRISGCPYVFQQTRLLYPHLTCGPLGGVSMCEPLLLAASHLRFFASQPAEQAWEAGAVSPHTRRGATQHASVIFCQCRTTKVEEEDSGSR